MMPDPALPPDMQAYPHSFAALLDRGYARPDFLQGLKTLMASAQERVRREHTAGARGRNVVRHLTALVDDVVRTIFQYVRANHAAEAGSCTLVALGGYGRGELNPFSDIDLMFLCEQRAPDQLVRDVLYLLWDVGYSLGHSVRTRRDVVHMAEADLTAQTAMLEARFIDGDPGLFAWFQDEVGHHRFTPRRRQAFLRQKVDECRKRHAGFANTVNLMEPNVKESPGGLRDYHTALWLGIALYQTSTLSGLVEQELITVQDQDAVEMALDFLFRVRNALHYRQGRKSDLLSVDVQEPLAAALGFAPSEHKLAVEHFLKAYYVHANVLFHLCLTLVEAATHTVPSRFWRLFRRPRPVGDGFVLLDGYLHHDMATHLSQSHVPPTLLLQAFAKAQEHRVPLAPALSRALKAQGPLLASDDARRSPEVAATFFRMLSRPAAASTLRALHRHGLLGAYIPEFDALTCLVQHDLYHRYTVDEHTLLSVEKVEGLSTPQDAYMQPLADLYHLTADKALLKFALLLHDLGKDIAPGQASHVYRSGTLAESVCARLNLPAEQRHLLQRLVVHHLAMNRIAQRRDITDEKVIAELASMVETVPALEQLYLLTFADTSAVAPDVWTVWKGTLLADLYRRTRAYMLRQGAEETLTDSEHRQRQRLAILDALDAQDAAAQADVEHFLEVMPARYLAITPPDQMARDVRLTQRAFQTPVALEALQNFSGGFTNVTICVAERRGVFSMIAGALSRHQLNILGAQIYTSRDGVAVDTLQVETTDNTPVTDGRIWQQVTTDIQAALAGELTFEPAAPRRRLSAQERKLQAFAPPPRVGIENTSSDSYTLIEVQAPDQLGLLYRLTRILYECGLDVALAKISTEANKAIDVFYVTDTSGQQLTDTSRAEGVRQALLSALR